MKFRSMSEKERAKYRREFARRWPALWDPIRGPIPGRGNATARGLILRNFYGQFL